METVAVVAFTSKMLTTQGYQNYSDLKQYDYHWVIFCGLLKLITAHALCRSVTGFHPHIIMHIFRFLKEFEKDILFLKE